MNPFNLDDLPPPPSKKSYISKFNKSVTNVNEIKVVTSASTADIQNTTSSNSNVASTQLIEEAIKKNDDTTSSTRNSDVQLSLNKNITNDAVIFPSPSKVTQRNNSISLSSEIVLLNSNENINSNISSSNEKVISDSRDTTSSSLSNHKLLLVPVYDNTELNESESDPFAFNAKTPKINPSLPSIIDAALPIQPTHESVSTFQPTTEAPSLFQPTIEATSTFQPHIESLSTFQPSMESISTFQPTIEAPSVFQPTIEPVSTFHPTTASVFQPTIYSVSTFQPTHESVSTFQPTTEAASTFQPTHESVSTFQPTTEAASVFQPTHESVSTFQPTHESVSTFQPTSEAASVFQPTHESVSTFQPTTEAPSLFQPTHESVSTFQPTTEAPSLFQPTIESISTFQPTIEQTPIFLSTSQTSKVFEQSSPTNYNNEVFDSSTSSSFAQTNNCVKHSMLNTNPVDDFVPSQPDPYEISTGGKLSLSPAIVNMNIQSNHNTNVPRTSKNKVTTDVDPFNFSAELKSLGIFVPEKEISLESSAHRNIQAPNIKYVSHNDTSKLNQITPPSLLSTNSNSSFSVESENTIPLSLSQQHENKTLMAKDPFTKFNSNLSFNNVSTQPSFAPSSTAGHNDINSKFSPSSNTIYSSNQSSENLNDKNFSSSLYPKTTSIDDNSFGIRGSVMNNNFNLPSSNNSVSLTKAHQIQLNESNPFNESIDSFTPSMSDTVPNLLRTSKQNNNIELNQFNEELDPFSPSIMSHIVPVPNDDPFDPKNRVIDPFNDIVSKTQKGTNNNSYDHGKHSQIHQKEANLLDLGDEEDASVGTKFKQMYNVNLNGQSSGNQDYDHDSADEDLSEPDYDSDLDNNVAPKPRDDMRPVYRSQLSTSTQSNLGITGGRYEDTAQLAHPSGIMEGHILARISARSLFIKDWGAIYWVMKDGALYLYRSKEDSEPGSRRESKKTIVITKHLRVLKLHEKGYGKIGNLFNFMLEEIKDYGPVNLVKFGSPIKANAEILWMQLRAAIAKERKASHS